MKISKVHIEIKEQVKTYSRFYLFSVKGEFYLILFSNVSLSDKFVKIKQIMR